MNPQNFELALNALDGTRPVLAHFDTPRTAEDLAADVIDLWAGVEKSLQALVGVSSLTGQQLVRAARQAELITLDQAHALLAFLAARDRAARTSYKPVQADGDAAVDGFEALESVLAAPAPVKREAPENPVVAAYIPRKSQPSQPANRNPRRGRNPRHPLSRRTRAPLRSRVPRRGRPPTPAESTPARRRSSSLRRARSIPEEAVQAPSESGAPWSSGRLPRLTLATAAGRLRYGSGSRSSCCWRVGDISSSAGARAAVN